MSQIRNIRRLAAVAAGGAAIFAGGGVAQAGVSNEYQNEPGSPSEPYVGFDIDNAGGKRVVENIQYYGPTRCKPAGGENFTYAQSMGRLVLKGNAFEGERKLSEQSSGRPGGTVTIDGKQTKQGVFRGTLRIKQVGDEGDELPGRCDTGPVAYKVERVRRAG